MDGIRLPSYSSTQKRIGPNPNSKMRLMTVLVVSSIFFLTNIPWMITLVWLILSIWVQQNPDCAEQNQAWPPSGLILPSGLLP